MTNVRGLQALATVYVLAAIMFICSMDEHVGISVLVVLCFMGAIGCNDLANDAKAVIELSMYEGTGND